MPIPAEVEAKIAGVKSLHSGGFPAKSSLHDFIAACYECTSAVEIAKKVGMTPRAAATRREKIEQHMGITLPRGKSQWSHAQNRRIELTIENGTILMGTDAHLWPDVESTAIAAFQEINKRLKPDYVVIGGDDLDGSGISRHGRIGWEPKPTVKQELEASQEFLHEVHTGNLNAKKIRLRGNHDGRFDSYLSANAPAMEGVPGFALADHFPGWQYGVSVLINGNFKLKHRTAKSGIHATWNSLRDGGINIAHGHLHSQKVVTLDNDAGRIYGVDCGMLAPVNGPQFVYAEDDSRNHRSGFALFTIRDYKLQPPELVTVLDEEAGAFWFRGTTYTVEFP